MRCYSYLLLILAFVSASSLANERPSPIGHVLELSGPSHVLRNNESHPTKKRLRLFKSDKLITGQDSRLKFRLVDGSIITLGARAEFDLTRYQFGQNNNGQNKAEFKLVKGVFRFITGKITAQAEPDVKVVTPIATIGIRGTDFWGGYLDENVIDVLLIESKHALVVANDKGSVTLGQGGIGTTIHPGSAPLEPRVWPASKVQRAVATIDMD